MHIFLKQRFFIIATILLVVTFASQTFADSVTQVFSGTSSNWAGYIAQQGSYTGVSGTWIMPEISYSAAMSSNATWVGIGGRSTNDLIQAGVYEIANSKGATYQAWYELLPDNSIPVDLAVHPGDSISVAILETSQDVWNIVITNNTSKQQFAKIVQYHSSQSSAEWIQERPLIDGTFSDLSGFTPIQFTGATVVQDGQRISMAQANAAIINMIDGPSNLALAVPSPIQADGLSFSVARTSATVSPATTVTTPTDSYVSPFILRRTGHDVIPFTPGITWILHFLGRN